MNMRHGKGRMGGLKTLAKQSNNIEKSMHKAECKTKGTNEIVKNKYPNSYQSMPAKAGLESSEDILAFHSFGPTFCLSLSFLLVGVCGVVARTVCA